MVERLYVRSPAGCNVHIYEPCKFSGSGVGWCFKDRIGESIEPMSVMCR